jgi:hypothetical protein
MLNIHRPHNGVAYRCAAGPRATGTCALVDEDEDDVDDRPNQCLPHWRAARIEPTRVRVG